ncbi:MAG: hypothetical protein AB1641_07885 [Thermodesulfobacteriota bacterium]
MIDPQALAEEERRIRELSRTVDLALLYLQAAPLDREQAQELVRRVRAKAMRLFPDKAATFDLIYQPRFRRVLVKRFGLN